MFFYRFIISGEQIIIWIILQLLPPTSLHHYNLQLTNLLFLLLHQSFHHDKFLNNGSSLLMISMIHQKQLLQWCHQYK